MSNEQTIKELEQRIAKMKRELWRRGFAIFAAVCGVGAAVAALFKQDHATFWSALTYATVVLMVEGSVMGDKS